VSARIHLRRGEQRRSFIVENVPDSITLGDSVRIDRDGGAWQLYKMEHVEVIATIKLPAGAPSEAEEPKP
jgi:hypothetical protein